MFRTFGSLGIASLLFAGAPGSQFQLSVSNAGSAEYLEVGNRGAAAVDLDGWIVLSVEGHQVLTLHDLTLTPGSSVRIVSGRTQPSPGDVVWTHVNIWNNHGDTAALYDARGTLVAATAYGRTRGSAPSIVSTVKGAGAHR